MDQTTAQKVHKTILIVDDNPMILKFVLAALAGHEFHVFSASNGADALQQAKNYKGEIHLLLSDFEMPGMNGIKLATALTVDRPNIQVLLMSGFTGGMLVLNEGWHFLPKPFIASQLLALIVTLISPERPSKFLEYPLPSG